jgi:threonine dehydrogenase-like Zn-dependent dehydrogenase
VARIKDMTRGIGADSVLECVGTQESMTQAINCTRRGGYVSYVGVPHGVGSSVVMGKPQDILGFSRLLGCSSFPEGGIAERYRPIALARLP